MKKATLRRRDVLALVVWPRCLRYPSTAPSRGRQPLCPARTIDDASSMPCSATCRTGTRPIARAEARREPSATATCSRPGSSTSTASSPCPPTSRGPKPPTGRAPAVLFNHSHGGGYKIGKQEFVDGRSYLQPVPVREGADRSRLRRAGIDHWVFGERSHTTEADMFKAMLWQGQVLWGMMVYDSLRAARLPRLQRADVDAGAARRRSASRWAARWRGGWRRSTSASRSPSTSAASPTSTRCSRRRACRAHGVYYYVPGLLKHFTTAQINALIAPRAHLGLAGLQDKLTPVEGLDIIDRELQRVYAEHGHPERWTAAALRRRAPGDRGRTRGDPRLPAAAHLTVLPAFLPFRPETSPKLRRAILDATRDDSPGTPPTGRLGAGAQADGGSDAGEDHPWQRGIDGRRSGLKRLMLAVVGLTAFNSISCVRPATSAWSRSSAG